MILKTLTILLLWACVAVSAQNNCCTGSQNYLGPGRCIDGGNITGITCMHRYMLDTKLTDTFTVDGDGNLAEAGYSISADRYCLSNDSTVALVCFPESEDSPIGDSKSIYYFRAACALISVLFLTATIFVYILTPNLLDLQGKCLLHSISALAIAMLLLCIMQFGVTIPDVLCTIMGYVTFVSFLTTFTWLNIISFHIWRTTVVPTALGTNKQWHILYCSYGYGVPLIILAISVIAHHTPGGHIKPGIGDYACWFTGRDATWAYFYGPIAFLLAVNVILFVWTVKTLWSDMRKNNDNAKIQSKRCKCVLYIKLFFIMGLSWIFEVLSFAFQNKSIVMDYIWMVTDFINALQGVLIFLILVAFRKRALRGLAVRGLFPVPRQWKTLQDEECEESAEEQRLAKEIVPENQMSKEKPNAV